MKIKYISTKLDKNFGNTYLGFTFDNFKLKGN